MHLLSGSLSVCLPYGRIWWGLVALKALSNQQKWRIERNVYPVSAITLPTSARYLTHSQITSRRSNLEKRIQWDDPLGEFSNPVVRTSHTTTFEFAIRTRKIIKNFLYSLIAQQIHARKKFVFAYWKFFVFAYRAPIVFAYRHPPLYVQKMNGSSVYGPIFPKQISSILWLQVC